MDRRRSSRIETHLPVRIWGVDAKSRPFIQEATARNISRQGAVIQGLRAALTPGEVLEVQHDDVRAQFLVVWVGRPNTPREGEIGLQALVADPAIWDVNFRVCAAAAGRG